MEVDGALVLRIEDLDATRCRPKYAQQVIDDLRWMGVTWTEGPVYQSQRGEVYLDVWRRLHASGAIYPSHVSRKDVHDAAFAPHDDEEGAEPLFPVSLRAPVGAENGFASPEGVVWRFRVPDGEGIQFSDELQGPQCFTAGVDFGDFIVWRKDNVPAYELAVVADDVAMQITEVVRGADLLKSTARQLLIYRVLGARPPAWRHESLVRDASGRRLAKRHQALSLRSLRERGIAWRDALADVLPP